MSINQLPSPTGQNPAGMLKRRIWTAVRILLSLALLWNAGRLIDWQALQDTPLDINPAWFLLALLCLVVSNSLAGLRWGWLMRAGGFKASLRRYTSLYFTGGFINQGLPTTLGGDGYRAAQAAHGEERVRKSVLIVALDRSLGLLGNLLLGAIGLAAAGDVLGLWAPRLGWAALIVLLLGILSAGVLLHRPRVLAWLEPLLTRFHLHEAMAAIRRAYGWPFNVGQLALSVGIHFLGILAFGCCMLAFGLMPPIDGLLVGMPALVLLIMLPISISGWGLRETTLAAVLLLWGVSPSLTVLASVSFGAINLISWLPGMYRLIRKKKHGH